VNDPPENMLAIAERVGLKYLQLHGEESAATVSRLGRTLPVIKAIRVRDSFRASQLRRFKRGPAFLLDGFHASRRGGTGKTFNWEAARRANRAGHIFLAGGLTPDNIGEAIRVARPYAVDVCSGVEAKPGKKDPALIASFMQAVRAARRKKR